MISKFSRLKSIIFFLAVLKNVPRISIVTSIVTLKLDTEILPSARFSESPIDFAEKPTKSYTHAIIWGYQEVKLAFS